MCTSYLIYKKKIIPQNKLTSQWYGVSSFPPLKRNYLIQTLNEQNFDIIVGVHAFLSLNLASIRHKLNARKVIGWMHTSFDAFFNTPGFYLWEQKNQFRHEMRKLDEIIVLSKNDCALYKSSLNLGSIPIYNPITIEAKNKYINNKKFLAIGRMSPKTKGFDILIKAFSIFAQNNTSWTLDIVGEGPEELYLRELIKENNLEQRVIIHPFTNDIGYYYSNASVYILSSRWEGLPLVLIEAMAFGLPIIASSISIVKEIISQSKNTFVFENENIADLADKLKHISLLSEEELEIMSQASITLSSNFEITSITNQWENIFNSNE